MSASNNGSESSWVDPDDAPEWTDEMFDRAEIRIGDTVIRRGRPPAAPRPRSRSASTTKSSPPSARKGRDGRAG